LIVDRGTARANVSAAAFVRLAVVVSDGFFENRQDEDISEGELFIFTK
jgi:hypothetical protein